VSLRQQQAIGSLSTFAFQSVQLVLDQSHSLLLQLSIETRFDFWHRLIGLACQCPREIV